MKITPEHIAHMLDTIEKRTRATLFNNISGPAYVILKHDFEAILGYAQVIGHMVETGRIDLDQFS